MTSLAPELSVVRASRLLSQRAANAATAIGAGGIVGASVPLALGLVAGSVGLAPTMWILLLAPVALLLLVPRSKGWGQTPMGSDPGS